MTTNIEDINIAIAWQIAEYIVSNQWDGRIEEYDAGQAWDEDAWLGFRVRSDIERYDVRRSSMYDPGIVGLRGDITVTDPEDGEVYLTVHTTRDGDVEID